MIDFTHTKRPDFIQLIIILAVACLALGAIIPAASAVAYDWEFSVQSPEGTIGEVSGYINIGENTVHEIPNALSVGSSVFMKRFYSPKGASFWANSASLVDFITNPGIYTDFPVKNKGGYFFDQYWVTVGGGLSASEVDVYVRSLASFIEYNTDASYYLSEFSVIYDGSTVMFWIYPTTPSGGTYPSGFNYSYEPASPVFPLYVDVVDSGNDYLISVSGFDGTQLAGSAYTIAVSTYSGGYNLPLTSFPMYLGDSPVHLWTTDQTFTLPIYLSDGVTPIDYYCVMSFPADPTATGYPFWWNMTTHGSLDYPFNTTYPPVVLPTPTPLIPSDIIPDPAELNNTINISGWYQEQGFEGNNITAPIYSGLRGFFTSTLIPFYDFFLTPIGSLAIVISDSAGTSTDAIYDSVDQLMIYAAPMNMVGGYVVLLVPDIVWVVVFAALTIGYAVLLIRISTGSIKDTINRFLGRW